MCLNTPEPSGLRKCTVHCKAWRNKIFRTSSNIYCKQLPALIQITARTLTKNHMPNNEKDLQLFFCLRFMGERYSFFYMSGVHLYNCTFSLEKGLETDHSDLNSKPSGMQPDAPHVASRASCCEGNLRIIRYDH